MSTLTKRIERLEALAGAAAENVGASDTERLAALEAWLAHTGMTADQISALRAESFRSLIEAFEHAPDTPGDSVSNRERARALDVFMGKMAHRPAVST